MKNEKGEKNGCFRSQDSFLLQFWKGLELAVGTGLIPAIVEPDARDTVHLINNRVGRSELRASYTDRVKHLFWRIFLKWITCQQHMAELALKTPGSSVDRIVIKFYGNETPVFLK